MSGKAGLREQLIPLKAGEPENVPVQGNYLRVRSALADLLIEVGDNDIYKMSAGEDITYPVNEEFSRIRITSLAGVDEKVSLQVGRNVRLTSSKLNGSVLVSALPPVQVAANQLIGIEPMRATGSKTHQDLLTANTPVSLLDAADNVNGAYLMRLSVSAVAAADFTLMAYMYNGGAFRYFAVGMHNGGSKTQMIDFDGPFYVPPGWAVAINSTVNTIAAATRASSLFKAL